MSTPVAPEAEAPTALERHARLRLTRGVTVTWWYTVSGVLFIELVLMLAWMGALAELGRPTAAVLGVGAGGIAWTASTLLLLFDYRHRTDASPRASGTRLIAPLAAAIGFGALAGALSGSWLIGILPLAQALSLLRWPPGVRVRLVIAITVVLAVLWTLDTRMSAPLAGAGAWWLVGIYSVLLPGMTVLSLWWWDVLVTLDRARASEARLAATQERLRVATDVHDLQGHHLQVIALQLELAERLMAADPAAGMAELRAARRSVDEARQGTRDLATRFRAVALADEIANAVDLLRAAGIGAESQVDADAGRAPASVLGPIIRETTTNVLRHGGGRRARVSLVRDDGTWRYEIANDAAEDAGETAGGGGAGLAGIERRVSEAGGRVEVRRERGEFSVAVTVPEAPEPGR